MLPSLRVFFAGVFLLSHLYAGEVSEKGFWIGEVSQWHITDWNLANALASFFHQEQAQSIVDFGCGEGDYAHSLLDNGFDVEAYDGNPDTPALTKGLGKIQDLSVPFDLHKQFDWVLSLEVGEHLPPQYEDTFIENLLRHAKQGILLSWAVKNQGGRGHFNEQENDYIKAIFEKHGFINDIEAENVLRGASSLNWFKNTIMIFRKQV